MIAVEIDLSQVRHYRVYVCCSIYVNNNTENNIIYYMNVYVCVRLRVCGYKFYDIYFILKCVHIYIIIIKYVGDNYCFIHLLVIHRIKKLINFS